jgi:hypothetical protein
LTRIQHDGSVLAALTTATEGMRMDTDRDYTLNNVGVYVDYGFQNADETSTRVIGIATDHGFKPEPCDAEWLSEIADEATTYMNDHFQVDGAYWAFDGDAGGWGLFAEHHRHLGTICDFAGDD